VVTRNSSAPSQPVDLGGPPAPWLALRKADHGQIEGSLAPFSLRPTRSRHAAAMPLATANIPKTV